MKRVLVTGGTKEDTAPIAVFIMNVKQMSPDLYDDIIVFHNGITKKNQQLIQQIESNVRFVRYRYPNSKIRILTNNTIRYFSSMVFCKYECLRLLQEYDQVIWSDYDVVLQRDISEITNDEVTQLLAPILKDHHLKGMFTIPKKELSEEFDMDGECITTPLMVFNRTLKNIDEMYQWCYNMTHELGQYIDLPEQCIFTMLAQKYHISYKTLPQEKYVCFAQEPDQKASILHAYGQPKFWNGLLNDIWEENYSKWLALGGCSYEQKKKNMLTRWFS